MSMKTIGITTTVYGNNWGEVWQAYALRKYINMNLEGYTATLLNYKCKSYRTLQKPGFEPYRNENGHKNALFQEFRESLCGLSGPPVEGELTPENTPDYDYYMFGSDGIWNTAVWKIPEFFGSFVPLNKRKIAYAPSVSSYPNQITDTSYFEKYINTFDYISVREKAHCDFLQQFTDKKVYFVCDPTLLLNSTVYQELISQINPPKPNRPYIFYYQPNATDNAIVSLVNKIARAYHMDVVHTFAEIPDDIFPGASISAKFVGPLEWLSYIKDAAIVITRSYHAAVFSILFERPLYAYVDRKTGARFESLLQTLNMEDRLIRKYMKSEEIQISYNYEDTRKKLQSFREDSYSYINMSLGINQ